MPLSFKLVPEEDIKQIHDLWENHPVPKNPINFPIIGAYRDHKLVGFVGKRTGTDNLLEPLVISVDEPNKRTILIRLAKAFYHLVGPFIFRVDFSVYPDYVKLLEKSTYVKKYAQDERFNWYMGLYEGNHLFSRGNRQTKE